MGHVLYHIPVIDDISMSFPLSLLVPLKNDRGYLVYRAMISLSWVGNFHYFRTCYGWVGGKMS